MPVCKQIDVLVLYSLCHVKNVVLVLKSHYPAKSVVLACQCGSHSLFVQPHHLPLPPPPFAASFFPRPLPLVPVVPFHPTIDARHRPLPLPRRSSPPLSLPSLVPFSSIGALRLLLLHRRGRVRPRARDVTACWERIVHRRGGAFRAWGR